ncbi:hypothetical protein D9758_012520 [Tetrapyrgos nigripes]|uniref:Uncharacterized protein n=1 Tax=Tetrapyrgos nigripes TaxID=182062 RepID=A0A8H5G373_9AGAR|nr:hypothetical protein D9758_012520 [Tetrapyrgos nigripes]
MIQNLPQFLAQACLQSPSISANATGSQSGVEGFGLPLVDDESQDREFEDFQAAILNASDIPAFESSEEIHAGVLKNDIKTEFHPNAGQHTTIQNFKDFGFGKVLEPCIPTDFTPWQPFHSRLDFEVAEFALHAGLSSDLTEDLIKLLCCCRDKPDPHDVFTIKSASQMQTLWDLAAVKTLQFQKAPIAVEYKGEEKVLMFISGHCGTGQKKLSQVRNWHHISIGMLVFSPNLMDRNGKDLLRNLGLQTPGGAFSMNFPEMQNHFLSFFMPTKTSYHPLVLRKAIQLLHDVLIYHRTYEMEHDWVVVDLLVGFQLLMKTLLRLGKLAS